MMLGSLLSATVLGALLVASTTALRLAVAPNATADAAMLPACRMLGTGGVGRIVAVGDIHGSAIGLREILLAANIIDSVDSCTWSTLALNKHTTLVQMGDLVDRGNEALEAWQCLDKLHETMPDDGNFIRIIGNHEMWWMENKLHMRNKEADTKEKVLTLVRRMKSQIASKELVGAHVIEVNNVPLLFVHAGYRATYLAASPTTDAKGLAVLFNDALTDSLKTCPKDWSPCDFDRYGELFQAGPERGGGHLGGPVWTDYSVLVADDVANGLLNSPWRWIQVVGHSAAYCDDGDESNGFPDMGHCPDLIRATADVESVCVDGGMVYGTRSYLEIDLSSGAMRAHEKEGLSTAWKVRQLNGPSLCAR